MRRTFCLPVPGTCWCLARIWKKPSRSSKTPRGLVRTRHSAAAVGRASPRRNAANPRTRGARSYRCSPPYRAHRWSGHWFPGGRLGGRGLLAHSSVLDGPGEGVVGNLLPALLAQREMRAERELLVHRDRLGPEITPGVGLVERGGADVVFPSGNEQQRCAVVVVEVDTKYLQVNIGSPRLPADAGRALRPASIQLPSRRIGVASGNL